MLQVISFSVIRQALAWEHIPDPDLRQLSFYEWQTHWSAEYRATWRRNELPNDLWASNFTDGSAAYFKFLQVLREAFCEDVTITECHYDPGKDHITALLYVTLPKEPIQLYLLPASD